IIVLSQTCILQCHSLARSYRPRDFLVTSYSSLTLTTKTRSYSQFLTRHNIRKRWRPSYRLMRRQMITLKSLNGSAWCLPPLRSGGTSDNGPLAKWKGECAGLMVGTLDSEGAVESPVHTARLAADLGP